MSNDTIKTVEIAAKIALFIFGVTLGVVVLFAGTRAALAATLRSETIITGDNITLGDIFDGAKNASYVLGPAPLPGKEMILNARTLYKIASSLDVDWKPSSSAEQIILRRESSIIPQSEISSVLEQKLKDTGVNDKFAIEYLNAPSDIILPSGTNETLEITAFNFDSQKNTFNAVIVAPSAEQPLKRVTVSGRIERLVSVPVLKSSLRNGDIIGALDIDFLDISENKLPNGAITNEKQLINMTPRRGLAGGKIITPNDLENPKMVDRGDTVTLVFATGPLMLTAKGKSLQAGAMGDTVRVANTDSNKNLQGIVTAHREITIR